MDDKHHPLDIHLPLVQHHAIPPPHECPTGDTRIMLFSDVCIRFSDDRNPAWVVRGASSGGHTLITDSKAFVAGGGDRGVVVTLASPDGQIGCWEDGQWLSLWDEGTGGKEAVLVVRWLASGNGAVILG